MPRDCCENHECAEGDWAETTDYVCKRVGEKPTVTQRKRVAMSAVVARSEPRSCEPKAPHDAHALKGDRWAACAACVRNFGHEIDERDLAIDLVVGA